MVSLSQSSDSDSQFLSLDSDLLSQDSLLSQGSQEDSPDTALLEAAKLWSLAEVEMKSSDLLQVAKSVLQDPNFSHELKLEAMGWLVERLLQLVPVFEVEDAILPPSQRSRCCSGSNDWEPGLKVRENSCRPNTASKVRV